MKVKLKKLRSRAILPAYASLGAGCFDLHACFEDDGESGFSVNGEVLIPTGLSFQIPDGFVMLVFSRSGHGFKDGVRLANCVGVIDSDYRGEVMVKLVNDRHHRFFEFGYSVSTKTFKHGDRVAQALILPLPKVEFVEVDDLSETIRGAGGFGSTGENRQLDLFKGV